MEKRRRLSTVVDDLFSCQKHLRTMRLLLGSTVLLALTSTGKKNRLKWKRKHGKEVASPVREPSIHVKSAVEKEMNESNITFNMLNAGIEQARAHSQDYGNTLGEGFLDLFTDMAKDQIFNKHRSVEHKPVDMIIQRNGGSGTSYFNLDAIWGYGCYCMFGDDWRKGHSKPVNEIDAACQKLHLCYKCAWIDGMHESEDCDPAYQTYVAPVMKDVDLQGMWVACSGNGNDNDMCKVRACCCDIMFAQKLLDFFFSGEIFDPSPKHDLGFDMGSECPRPAPCVDGNCGPSGPEGKACCGEYPDRFPFATKGGSRACCYHKTYNVNKLQCCADHSLRKEC